MTAKMASDLTRPCKPNARHTAWTPTSQHNCNQGFITIGHKIFQATFPGRKHAAGVIQHQGHPHLRSHTLNLHHQRPAKTKIEIAKKHWGQVEPKGINTQAQHIILGTSCVAEARLLRKAACHCIHEAIVDDRGHGCLKAVYM